MFWYTFTLVYPLFTQADLKKKNLSRNVRNFPTKGNVRESQDTKCNFFSRRWRIVFVQQSGVGAEESVDDKVPDSCTKISISRPTDRKPTRRDRRQGAGDEGKGCGRRGGVGAKSSPPPLLPSPDRRLDGTMCDVSRVPASSVRCPYMATGHRERPGAGMFAKNTNLFPAARNLVQTDLHEVWKIARLYIISFKVSPQPRSSWSIYMPLVLPSRSSLIYSKTNLKKKILPEVSVIFLKIYLFKILLLPSTHRLIVAITHFQVFLAVNIFTSPWLGWVPGMLLAHVSAVSALTYQKRRDV